jgi:hypothetical protein
MIIANRAVHANGVICDLPIKNEVSGLALASIYRGVLTLYDCLRFVIEFRHELSRTNLCGLIRGIGDGDFDVRDADVFFCVCGNPRRAKSSDTARHGSVWSDTHLFCRGYCLCSRGCRVWTFHIQVFESSESGLVVSQFCGTKEHTLYCRGRSELDQIRYKIAGFGGWLPLVL